MLSFLHGEEDTICFENLFKEGKVCENIIVDKKKYVFEKAAKKIELFNSQLIKNPVSGSNIK